MRLPSLTSSPHWPDFTADAFAFRNGLKGYVTHGGTPDVIQLTCMVDAGNRFQQHPLTAFMAASMLSEGTPRRTSAQISDLFDFCGANYSVQTTEDHSFITLMTLRKHLDALLPVLADILYEPTFPEQPFRLLLEQTRQKHLLAMQHNQTLSSRHLLKAMFGTVHGYGRPVADEDFDRITPDLVTGFYRAAFHPSRTVLFVAGKATPGDLALIARHLDRPVPPCSEEGLCVAGPEGIAPDPQHIFHIVRPQDTQTSVRFGVPVCTLQHPDQAALMVMKTVLGGYFGSRLMQNLRTDKGITYGADAAVITLQHARYLQLLTDVKGDSTPLAIKEIHNEIDRLRQQLVPSRELSLAKRYNAGRMLRNVDGPFMRDNLRTLMHIHHLPDNWYIRQYEAMLDVSAQQVQDVAQKYLRDDALYEVACGGLPASEILK